MSALDLLLILIITLLALALWWALARAGARSRRRNAVAQRAEADAEDLLEDLGFRLLDRQITGSFDLLIDGEAVRVSCRADLLVERRGRVFIAECKSGRTAPSPTFPATRRQLLEYLLAFDVDGVLLVDMTARTVHTVAWPDVSP